MLDIQDSEITPRYAFAVGDKVTFSGMTWIVFERIENGFAFRPENGERPVQEFTNTQLAHFVRIGDLSHVPFRTPANVDSDNTSEVAAFLASRTDEQHAIARGREALVLGFDSLYQDNRVKCTHDSMEANVESIVYRAGQINDMSWDKNPNIPATFTGRTLHGWRARYHKYGLIGLYDASPQKGNRNARLTQDVLEIITPCIQRYAESNPPTKKQIYENVEIAIADANKIRSESNKLKAPSQTTINKKIKELDPFLVCLAHHGEAHAKRKYSASNLGPQAVRPLQRVEIDEWRADLITLLSEANLLGWLEEPEKLALGLKKDRMRVLVTVAICTATKCIVGMTISPEGNSDSARQTIEMILDDKGQLAKNSGARKPWCMSGRPALIVTDCAKYNISDATRRTVAAIGTRLEHCPAGEPQMKGTVERIFRTISTRLLPRLVGRTYSDVVSKGDRNPEDSAALTVEDFCQILVRWIVDIYHVTPHRGLRGETPFDCWQRLVADWGVNPSPKQETRILAFGTQETRIVQQNGIARMGIQYHHKDLAEWFLHNSDRKVSILWHRSDLGHILVEIDGKWLPISSARPMFRGLSGAEWEQIVRTQRAHNKRKAALHEDAVHEAIKAITNTNARAIRNAGVMVEQWSEKRIGALESECLMAFADDSEQLPEVLGADTAAGLGLGIELPTAGDAATILAREPQDIRESHEDAAESMSLSSAGSAPQKASKSISDQNSATTRPNQRRARRGSGPSKSAETTWSFKEK